MNGVGEVYEMFSSGAVDGDDEVAVLHGPAEQGYPATTVALVNLRHGVAQGTVDPEAGARIVAAAKARPFTHRSWDELARRPRSGRPRGAGRARGRRGGTSNGSTPSPPWTRSRAERPDVAGAWSADVALTGITHYEALKWRSARDLDVMNAARLFAPDYPDVHAAVLEELLAEFGGETYTREARRVRRRTAPELESWLAPDEQRLPMAERLRLVMIRVWPVWQSEDWRRAVLDRLRAHPNWDEWSGLLVAAKLARATTKAAAPPPEFCARLFLRHWKTASPQVEMARRGFYGMDDLGRTVTPFFALDAQRRR